MNRFAHTAGFMVFGPLLVVLIFVVGIVATVYLDHLFAPKEERVTLQRVLGKWTASPTPNVTSSSSPKPTP